MVQIADTDRVLRLMRTVAQYDGELGDEGLPREVLKLLAELVPCDNLSVSGQDTPRWDFFLSQSLYPDELPASLAEASAEAYHTHYWSSDCSYPDRTGDVQSVLRTSDLETRADRLRSPMYCEFDRLFGVEHEVRVVLASEDVQRTVRLIFHRGGDPDFSDRDVAVLTLLRPHLQALWTRVMRQRRGVSRLTGRQEVVVRYAAQGSTNAQIASRLGISEGTVRKHLENAYARLHVNNRVAAVAALGEFGASQFPSSRTAS